MHHDNQSEERALRIRSADRRHVVRRGVRGDAGAFAVPRRSTGVGDAAMRRPRRLRMRGWHVEDPYAAFEDAALSAKETLARCIARRISRGETGMTTATTDVAGSKTLGRWTDETGITYARACVLAELPED